MTVRLVILYGSSESLQSRAGIHSTWKVIFISLWFSVMKTSLLFSELHIFFVLTVHFYIIEKAFNISFFTADLPSFFLRRIPLPDGLICDTLCFLDSIISLRKVSWKHFFGLCNGSVRITQTSKLFHRNIVTEYESTFQIALSGFHLFLLAFFSCCFFAGYASNFF